jgi:arsenical pump membrane protein
MVLAIWRPRGLAIGWPALGGALLCVGLGLVGLREVERVLALTWNAVLALIGLMVLSATLEENGAFRAAAYRVARLSAGSGRRLFFGLCLLTCGATALIANDGAVLVLTPIVFELTGLLGFPAAATLAFLFATGFLCDALSIVLPTSNLTNILMIDAIKAHPGVFFAKMIGPALIALLVGITALTIELGRAVPRRFDAGALGPPPAFSPRSARATFTALAALLGGYGLAALLGFPLGAVILVVSIGLALVEHHARAAHLPRILRQLPWSVVVFAVALFVVVIGLADHGAAAVLAASFAVTEHPARHVLAVGAEVGALAAFANNLPVLLVSVLALKNIGATTLLPYAALLGANIGSKLTPVGSLATLLWLEMLRRRGLRLSWGRYTLYAAAPTAATLAAALLILAAEHSIFGG